MTPRRTVIAATALLVFGLTGTARAQAVGDPADARFQLGSFAAAPTIQLTNTGFDDNVFHDSRPEDRREDVTATVSPAVNAWLRLPAVRLSGRSELDVIYYRRLTDLRALDTANTGRVELVLNRLAPYVEGEWTSTRHRRNLEIDAPVRRLTRTATAGADVRITPKLSVGAAVHRSTQEYQGDTLYLDTDLAHALSFRGSGESVRARFAVTPLTTLGVTATRRRDRFDLAPERDSTSTWILPEVEFRPFALISGRAAVGFRSRRFDDGRTPEFRGTSAEVDLRYTLLGRTRFEVGAERDLNYSYRPGRDYLLTGIRLSVTQHVSGPWDVQASIGRSRLVYQQLQLDAPGTPEEIVSSVGVGVGFRMGTTRLGVQATRQDRQSNFSARREYDRLRVTSNLTYGF